MQARQKSPGAFEGDEEIMKRCNNLRKQFLKDHCEECGLTDKSLMVLHHILPICDGGKDDAEENLKTVCPNCHRKIHLKLSKERKENPIEKKVKEWLPLKIREILQTKSGKMTIEDWRALGGMLNHLMQTHCANETCENRILFPQEQNQKAVKKS